jgi:hypothetical protein
MRTEALLQNSFARSVVAVGQAPLARSGIRFSLDALFLIALVAASTSPSYADENGISFWLPGFFGSLASTPQQPGWSLASVYYHTDVSASGSAAVSREITLGQFNPKLNININANVHGVGDLGIFAPSYVFATPFLGGQASAALLGMYGRNDTSLNATVSTTPIPFTRSVALQQADMAFGDVIPQFAVRWNAGVNNYMAYVTGDLPVGKYDSQDLANLGLGHGAIDGGVGYTYFDPKAGNEFSATFGVTGNFKNEATNYTSGIDSHLDLGASKFLTKQLQVGLVGYFYKQLTPDSGQPPILGSFESQVAGIGPQIGYIFPVAGMQGYINLKGYKEFDADDRPHGYNVWLTFVLSPAPPSAASSPPPMLTKAPPHG